MKRSCLHYAEAHVWRADGEQAGSGGFVEGDLVASDPVGGASPTRCSGGAGAGWASGMSVGSPRCPMERTITAGSSIRAISVRRLPHRGQASTSSRCRNDASTPNVSSASGTPRTRVRRKAPHCTSCQLAVGSASTPTASWSERADRRRCCTWLGSDTLGPSGCSGTCRPHLGDIPSRRHERSRAVAASRSQENRRCLCGPLFLATASARGSVPGHGATNHAKFSHSSFCDHRPRAMESCRRRGAESTDRSGNGPVGAGRGGSSEGGLSTGS